MPANTSASELSKILASYSREEKCLIPVLQKVQGIFGYISEEAVREIAAHVHMSRSDVYGVATFYTQFRFVPVGRKHISVCRGTACHVKGADQILEHVERHLGINEGDTTPDGEYSLETVACIGCCALAPCMTINKDVHGRLTSKRASKILQAGAKE